MHHSQDRPQVQRAREPPDFGVPVLEAVGALDPAIRGLLCLDVWERWEVHTQLRSAQMRREGKRPLLWPRSQDLSVPTGPEAVTCFPGPSPTAQGPPRGSSAVSRGRGPQGADVRDQRAEAWKLPWGDACPPAPPCSSRRPFPRAAQGREPAVHRTAGSALRPQGESPRRCGQHRGRPVPRRRSAESRAGWWVSLADRGRGDPPTHLRGWDLQPVSVSLWQPRDGPRRHPG